MGGMAQGASGSSRRVRPVSWLILAVCFLLIVAILAAWRGSAELNGRIPQVRFATDQWTLQAEPVFWNTPFDNGGAGKQFVRPLSEKQNVSVGLPGELNRATVTVFVTRQIGQEESTTEVQTYTPGTAGTLSFPGVTDQGMLRELVVSSGSITALDADGQETLLGGEWSLQLREQPKPGTARLEGLPAPQPLPDHQIIEIPERMEADAAHGGALPNPHG